MGPTTFEERLLPLLVEELAARPAVTISRRPRAVRAVALLAAALATVVGLALVMGGSSDGTITVTVVSASMLPSLTPGDTVTVDTDAYGSSVPSRGDIVAFRLAEFPENVFLKRVIGLPGDVVEEVDGVVSVNGQVLDEPYADLDHLSGSWVVEPGHVFVMGDARANSSDSRFTGEGGMGQLLLTDIIGKVLPGTASGAPDISGGPAPAVSRPSDP